MYHIHKAQAKNHKVNIAQPVIRPVVRVALPTGDKEIRTKSRGGGGICKKQPSASWKKLKAELERKAKPQQRSYRSPFTYL